MKLKKSLSLLLALALAASMAACGSKDNGSSGGQPQGSSSVSEPGASGQPQGGGTAGVPFEVGSDFVEEESVAATEYSPIYTVNVRIAGPDDDVLFSGRVALKSPTMWANEFIKAAVTDKGLAQDGLDAGFTNTIGDYTNNSADEMYWTYSVNGDFAVFGSNQFQLRDGDYIEYKYGPYEPSDPMPAPTPTGDWVFEPGSDFVQDEGPGASEYSPTFTVNLKIVGAEDDVLFDGRVELKSPTMMGSEFLKAAVTDKGLAQDGIDVGFVTTIGDYVNNSADNIYWLYTINGQTPDFGCNGLQMRDGDYMVWTYTPLD